MHHFQVSLWLGLIADRGTTLVVQSARSRPDVRHMRMYEALHGYSSTETTLKFPGIRKCRGNSTQQGYLQERVRRSKQARILCNRVGAMVTQTTYLIISGSNKLFLTSFHY